MICLRLFEHWARREAPHDRVLGSNKPIKITMPPMPRIAGSQQPGSLGAVARESKSCMIAQAPLHNANSLHITQLPRLHPTNALRAKPAQVSITTRRTSCARRSFVNESWPPDVRSRSSLTTRHTGRACHRSEVQTDRQKTHQPRAHRARIASHGRRTLEVNLGRSAAVRRGTLAGASALAARRVHHVSACPTRKLPICRPKTSLRSANSPPPHG